MGNSRIPTKSCRFSISGSPSYLEQKTAAIQDAKLKDRAGSLQNLIHARWATSTSKKYSAAWNKWEIWCDKHPESPKRPADRFYIALYINDLVIEGGTYGTLEAASAGIRWGHITTGSPNPMEDLFLKTIMEGAKRTIGKPQGSKQKEPMSADMAKQVVSHYGCGTNLLHHRLVVICLVGLSGFL